MITPEDLKRIAREKGVDPTTIEQDHVQNWFLKSLFENSDHLIFKGGTSIRKAFIPDYRFSDDLDFTLSGEVSQEDIEGLINTAKEYVRDEVGVMFEADIQFQDVESGWKVKSRYDSRITRRPIRLIMDLTHSNLEIVVTEPETHPLIHDYDDGCYVELKTYSLIEITAEKSRALCQRGWPRDLYDVHNLWPLVEKEEILNVFKKKCEFKGFEPSLMNYDNNKEGLKSAWEKSLSHQLKGVPDFEAVFNEVRSIIKGELKVQ